MTTVMLSQVPAAKVGRANAQTAVAIDVDNPHGQLEISTGGVKWTPKTEAGIKQRARSRRVSWKVLVELLNEKGRAP